MSKNVSFKWKNNVGWTWEATKYEGNGVFFGKVTSPYVTDGEYGTWYLWELEESGSGVRLVEGDAGLLAKIRKYSEKSMLIQKAILKRRSGL